MKILWVKSDFLHPTTKGGQIRTLETLRRLHVRHEIHYVAFADPTDSEGPARSGEYCAHSYPIRFSVSGHSSPRFYAQLVTGLYSRLPVALQRYRCLEMERAIANLQKSVKFDALVCDFLTPSVNIPDMERFFLFQHNVETVLWQRHAENAANMLKRKYFQLQAARMRAYEESICRRVRHTIAVSAVDATWMRDQFGISRISEVATGVDIDYFRPPSAPGAGGADLVFVGSMDWLPNIEGMKWFLEQVFPLILKQRPSCTVAVVGRRPSGAIMELAHRFSGIRVTGTVDDVRPFLWGSLVSIVPIHIGGGTRLKIYEAMAAKVPVVSTTVGAEGLAVVNRENILLADAAQDFAECCLRLLDDAEARRALTGNAWDMVAARFSWESVAGSFADILQNRAS